ncbi:Gfo/Idh/MocA family oxidoreductase [Catenulispora sp. NL8]|uniref:Gfo/Idh/MocA family oxidoreductase n=1 Tax=Catenulispora pinistramenti TaxID=2705254 RepID=A0ABS5KR83_9ACTN|nr:Gfo/Idh/MocA family oxidoreductase [Catenulispora pinistramenti]MBS2548563.1 Gfo/Idh/MocA family oxidoreductase [Catenulispora pinistramenti]
MHSPPLSHAIVGCGRVAPNHVDAFRALGEGWTLAWACDRDPAVAAGFAAVHGIAEATADYGLVLADPAVTSVSIAVDHAQHAALARRALLAGKHVIVEKPLALSAADAEDLLETARSRGRILTTVSQHRYDPLVVGVREWLKAGLLGRLRFVRASLEASREEVYYSDSYWRGTWRGEGGSALINQGYHCLDVTQAVCGDLTVRAAAASAGDLYSALETEDTIGALLTAGPVPVTLTVTIGSTVTWRTRLEFVGTEGTVELDIDHPARLHRATGNPELERRAAECDQSAVAAEAPGIDYYGISHRRQIADFAAAVATGGAMDVRPEAGVAMVRLLGSLYAAAGLPGPGQIPAS